MYSTTVCGGSMEGYAPSRCSGAATVPAGSACQSDICGENICATQQLATLSMENQAYVDGFCPPDALACGTMFPCLVM